MKILYVTSEVAPYATSGGLGDVMSALPLSVSELYNNNVSVIMPLYNIINDVYKCQMEFVTDITFNLSWRSTGARIYRFKKENVKYYFIENHYYFDRGKLYEEFDDAERFAFFSKAVIEYILKSDDIPDILHANDWQCAPSIIYLKTVYSNVEKLNKIKTVYTIHNIEYQGRFDNHLLEDVYGIDRRFLEILEFDGFLNLTKGAIVISDYVTTVSPNYANELQYDFFAFGLSEIIKSSKHKIAGIINGIDYKYFSPEKDADIYQAYSQLDYKSGKAKNKEELQKDLGLKIDKNVPLIVMITRLAHGKGIDLILCIIEELLNEKIQFVLLGTGEEYYENEFKKLALKHDNFKALIKFDRVFSKKIYAAADMFLMPSKSEPCGLAQMIACSYGTVPIVRAIGGLHDTIINYGEENSNGFTFSNYNAHELLFTVKKACQVYEDKKEWDKISSNAKSSKFEWLSSAEKYIQIYKNLHKR